MPLVTPGCQPPRIASLAADDPQTPRKLEHDLGVTHRRVPQEQRRSTRTGRGSRARHGQERREDKHRSRPVGKEYSDSHEMEAHILIYFSIILPP